MDFGGAAPDHHQPVDFVARAKVFDVFLEFLCQVPLGLGVLDVRAVELADVVLVEDRLHRFDGAEQRTRLLEVLRAEDAGFGGGVVGVVGEDVPPAEHDIVQLCQRNKLLDLGDAIFGALAQPDGSHLRERADGGGLAPADQLHAGDKCGGDGTHAGRQHAQLALGGRNLRRTTHEL